MYDVDMVVSRILDVEVDTPSCLLCHPFVVSKISYDEKEAESFMYSNYMFTNKDLSRSSLSQAML
jgi:hypothetical protein